MVGKQLVDEGRTDDVEGRTKERHHQISVFLILAFLTTNEVGHEQGSNSHPKSRLVGMKELFGSDIARYHSGLQR